MTTIPLWKGKASRTNQEDKLSVLIAIELLQLKNNWMLTDATPISKKIARSVKIVVRIFCHIGINWKRHTLNASSSVGYAIKSELNWISFFPIILSLFQHSFSKIRFIRLRARRGLTKHLKTHTHKRRPKGKFNLDFCCTRTFQRFHFFGGIFWLISLQQNDSYVNSVVKASAVQAI